MTVATLRMDLRLGQGESRRERRRQYQAIMDKLHRHFNVSVAFDETSGGGDPDASVLYAAAVGNSRREVRTLLEHVADAIAAHPRAEVVGQSIIEV